MATTLSSISNELSEIVQSMDPYVVSVRARRHYPSSGLRWGSEVIVTASHTIQREEDIAISLADGTTAEASFVGRDPGSDLAVLKVKQSGPSAADCGVASAVKAGELALVIGRSPDSGVNASFGIVSAASGRWRTWAGGQLDSYIRLDARMFPQSSGGAVVNGRGQIVGMATSALSRIAPLAISAATITSVTAKLLDRGFLPRGYLGIGVQAVPLSQGLRQKLAVSNESGLMVLTVEPNGPAEKGGVLPGDMLLAADDVTTEKIEDLQAFSYSVTIGKTAKIKLIRGGALDEALVVVSERPGRKD
jgi:S1-C subfamily serine protease